MDLRINDVTVSAVTRFGKGEMKKGKRRGWEGTERNRKESLKLVLSLSERKLLSWL